jgi:hypothetical protein
LDLYHVTNFKSWKSFPTLLYVKLQKRLRKWYLYIIVCKKSTHYSNIGGRPCTHKGKTYQDGESFKDDCNTCNCNDGIAGCTRMACRKFNDKW